LRERSFVLETRLRFRGRIGCCYASKVDNCRCEHRLNDVDTRHTPSHSMEDYDQGEGVLCVGMKAHADYLIWERMERGPIGRNALTR
jgi:hypothetical protein